MVEKRFTVDSNDRKSLWDNERTEPLIAFGLWGIDDCCNLLNNLHEENEQLKQEIKDLRIRVFDSLHEADEIKCSCNPCVVEECVKKVVI